MRLTMHVTITILLSSFLLWSQTPGENTEAEFSDGMQSMRLLDDPLFTLTNNTRAMASNVFSMRLNPSPTEIRLPEMSEIAWSPDHGTAFDAREIFPQASASKSKAFDYSDGYLTRQKIHKYASIATLPLFVSEAVVGQKLYDEAGTESDSLRSAHTGLAIGIGALCGVNGVTGIWNMWEGRKNPSGRGKKLFHGILMLAANAGFVATAAMAPDHDEGEEAGMEEERNGHEGATRHRAVALTSLGVATVGYIYMLFAR
jgi:hypothetical protein